MPPTDDPDRARRAGSAAEPDPVADAGPAAAGADRPRAPIGAQLVRGGPALPAERAGEPPVVARMVVEIRSDGSRTIARGAMEDVQTGRSVGIEAWGQSPFQLAATLARSIFTLPGVARGLLGGRRRR